MDALEQKFRVENYGAPSVNRPFRHEMKILNRRNSFRYEMKIRNLFRNEMKRRNSFRNEMKIRNLFRYEMKRRNSFRNEMKRRNLFRNEMKIQNLFRYEMKRRNSFRPDEINFVNSQFHFVLANCVLAATGELQCIAIILLTMTVLSCREELLDIRTKSSGINLPIDVYHSLVDYGISSVKPTKRGTS